MRNILIAAALVLVFGGAAEAQDALGVGPPESAMQPEEEAPKVPHTYHRYYGAGRFGAVRSESQRRDIRLQLDAFCTERVFLAYATSTPRRGMRNAMCRNLASNYGGVPREGGGLEPWVEPR